MCFGIVHKWRNEGGGRGWIIAILMTLGQCLLLLLLLQLLLLLVNVSTAPAPSPCSGSKKGQKGGGGGRDLEQEQCSHYGAENRLLTRRALLAGRAEIISCGDKPRARARAETTISARDPKPTAPNPWEGGGGLEMVGLDDAIYGRSLSGVATGVAASTPFIEFIVSSSRGGLRIWANHKFPPVILFFREDIIQH